MWGIGYNPNDICYLLNSCLYQACCLSGACYQNIVSIFLPERSVKLSGRPFQEQNLFSGCWLCTLAQLVVRDKFSVKKKRSIKQRLHATLQVLYLHGNQISQLSEVTKLQKVGKLTKLTLHGNPIQQRLAYRPYILAHMTHLKALDFSPVTQEDKNTATVWLRGHKVRKA